jgi:hypothetical protein
MVVHKFKPLMIEAVVRGYIIGSGWKDYQKTGKVCGIELPAGLKEAEKLPQVIFTPATKAPAGEHDENISFDEAAQIVGAEMAASMRSVACLSRARMRRPASRTSAAVLVMPLWRSSGASLSARYVPKSESLNSLSGLRAPVVLVCLVFIPWPFRW